MHVFAAPLFAILLLLCDGRKDETSRNITQLLVGHCYRDPWVSDAETTTMVVSAELAAAHVNDVIDNINIRIIQNDTSCNHITIAKVAIQYFTELGVDALLGPSCPTGMEKVGVFAAAWDRPVIGYHSTKESLADKEMFPTLGRVSFALNEYGSAAAKFLKELKWKKVGYIYRDSFPCRSGGEFSELFKMAARKDNIDITIEAAVRNRRDKSELNIALEKIQKNARIVVVCMGSEIYHARELFIEAHKANMMGDDYVYIAIWGNRQFRRLPWEYGDENDALMKKLFSKILVMLPQAYDYEIFKPWSETVEKVTRERYNITEAQFQESGVKISLIHDGMLLYGRAVSECLKRPNCIYTSGKDLFDLMRNQEFQGASGHVVMSDTADRLPDFIIQTFSDDQWKTNLFLHFEQVFSPNGIVQLNRHIELGIPLKWNTVDSKPPPDTPICEFDGSKCKTDYTGAIIIGAVICAVFLVAMFGLGMRWKNKKFEESILVQSWRIDASELNIQENFGTSMKSIHNLRSISPGDSPPLQRHGNEMKALCRARKVIMYVYPKKENVEFSKRHDLLFLKQLRELQHENINEFVGICLDKNDIKTVWNYCQKEGLDDILYNNEITLDEVFQGSILKDLVKGLEYIHLSKIGAHGRLLIRNCYVDSHWIVKIGDFYVEELMRPFLQKGSIELSNPMKIDELLEMAPEVARTFSEKGASNAPTAEADIYGLGMIFFQVLFREKPFSFNDMNQEEILEHVKAEDDVRPVMPNERNGCSEQLITLLESCWKEEPEHRPTIEQVTNIVFGATSKNSGNLVDHMKLMKKIMEQYAKNLEEMVESRTKELIDERERADQLLFRMLPVPIALKLKRGIDVQPEYFESITLMFSDIVGFTNICSQSTPQQVVQMMNGFYSDFDEISEKFDVYKVETIGDAYMVASGLPVRNDGKHVTEMAGLALSYRKQTMNKAIPHLPGKCIQTRCGIHTGPVAAGVVGMQMPHYCLFSDTVNMASRMESTGLPMKIQLSKVSKDLIETFDCYRIKYRGEIEVKGKGFQPTYWLEEMEENV